MTKINVELVVEKTIAEQLEDAKKTGKGIIIPVFNILHGTMNNDKDDTFDISIGGMTQIFFHFQKGKRRVNFDLTPLITAAYKEAIKE